MSGPMENEKEVTLPRNSKFKVESYNPDTHVVEVTYLGQELPLPDVPIKTKEETAFDKEMTAKSNLSKYMINKESFNIN